MLVIPGRWWTRAAPVAPSDTVSNVEGAQAIHNRSASSMLVSVTDQVSRTYTLRVPAAGEVAGNSKWVRVNATGTTGGGTSGASYEAIKTSAVGLAFTNQPANDGVEVVSSNAADTTQTLTVYGTTQGTDTVVVETVTLNGTTVVSTVKTDWGVILGVELSAVAAGTVTVREASADATITTLTTGQLSKGVETVTTSFPTAPPMVVASGATTKQIGLYGTSLAGAAQGDSQALTGATALAMNLSFGSITKILTGDLEATRTVTFSNSSDLIGIY